MNYDQIYRKFSSKWNNSYSVYIRPKDLRIAAATHTITEEGIEAA